MTLDAWITREPPDPTPPEEPCPLCGERECGLAECCGGPACARDCETGRRMKDASRRYGAWAGNPVGFPEDPQRCVESLHGRFHPGGRQCHRKRGHGEGGLYCKQHDPAAVEARRQARHDKWDAEAEADRKRRALQSAAADLLAVVTGFRQKLGGLWEWLTRHAPARLLCALMGHRWCNGHGGGYECCWRCWAIRPATVTLCERTESHPSMAPADCPCAPCRDYLLDAAKEGQTR